MANTWKEWYLDGKDGTYKLCRGTRDGEPEVSLYFQQEDGTFELVISIVGLTDYDADGLVWQLIDQYDTKKVFSKSTKVGKSKADDYN